MLCVQGHITEVIYSRKLINSMPSFCAMREHVRCDWAPAARKIYIERQSSR